MSARRGTKIPGGLAAVATLPAVDSQVFVVGLRPLRSGPYLLPPGVEVPGAASWPRIEAWVTSRVIHPAGAPGTYVTFEDYVNALPIVCDQPALPTAEERAVLEAEALAAVALPESA